MKPFVWQQALTGMRITQEEHDTFLEEINAEEKAGRLTEERAENFRVKIATRVRFTPPGESRPSVYSDADTHGEFHPVKP